jgi:hypothetical protein
MSRDYPVPSYAANIWVTGDQIWIGLEGRSTPFPCTIPGMQLLITTLRERSRGSVSFAQNGAPTRYQVERTLQRDKRWNEMVRLMQARGSAPANYPNSKSSPDPELDAILKQAGL